MRNIEGLYTAIKSIINQRESEHRLAIDTAEIIEDVKKEVDVYSASLDWYIQQTLRSAVEVGLYQAGYRSVVKGEGIFVNPENCKKPEYLSRLFNNAKISELQKKKIVGIMMKAIKTAGMQGQLSFDFENGMIVEDITEEELIRMLRQDAKEAI